MAKRCLEAFVLVLVGAMALSAHADMKPLAEDDMSNVSGQYGGMSLSGDISFNKNGGPLDGEGVGFDCASGTRCGSRIAAQLSEGGGWFVLDDLQGTFVFDGLTLRTRTIDSTDTGFGADAGNFNRAVIEIGMPDTARFENFSYTLATSSTARPTGTDFQQTERLSVEMDGDITLDGNMLVFPLNP